VTGTTRSADRAKELERAGVAPAVLDVFDAEAVTAALRRAQPEVVIHQLTDLPDNYKERLKPLFLQYSLVMDRRDLLLGGSRIDLAALVIAKSIRDHLSEHGSAFFYIPLSLLLNEGAHAGFRRFQTGGVGFALRKLYDFEGVEVFPGIATRYGAAHFQRDAVTSYPVPCLAFDNSRWRRHWAAPLFERSGALSVFRERSAMRMVQRSRIPLHKDSRPRQGVNTCGANGVLIFSNYRPFSNRMVDVDSEKFGRVRLPSKFLYPLLEKEQFDDPRIPPRRYILLAHEPIGGRPLT